MDWKAKLAAYLHDPPEKAFGFTPNHAERVKIHASAFGLQMAEWQSKHPDWSASAADRFIFPKGSIVSEKEISFIHPFSGHKAIRIADFPDSDNAQQYVADARPEFNVPSQSNEQTISWLAWRLWLEYAATHYEGQKKGAEYLPYLPADTRVPDHTIWHHCSVTSAIEAARGDDGKLYPAFLLFQLNPVQDYITQARSTRDLWSGSYLISWLMAHAIKALADELGPDCIIFPSLRGLPLYDWLNRDKLQLARYVTGEGKKSESYWSAVVERDKSFEDRLLTPNMPHRFLALVPHSFEPTELKEVLEALKVEWKEIADNCFKWMEERACPPDKKLWDYQVQVNNFWQITWQLWPWPKTCKKALGLFETIPLGKESDLHSAYETATAIPDNDRDTRCYRDENGNITDKGDLDPGWAWSANYQLLQHRLDARRQTRDFPAWQGKKDVVKDDYSGKEESVIDEDWLKCARKNNEISYLFRSPEKIHLGAVNLIKRVWHKAYLEKVHGLKRALLSFDSVPAIAAAPYADYIFRKTEKDQNTEEGNSIRKRFAIFMRAAADCKAIFPEHIAPHETTEKEWFRRTDASVFYAHLWEKEINRKPKDRTQARTEDELKLLCTALSALKDLTEAVGNQPSKYYAVLALDGDQIGKWLSGEKSPPVKNVLAKSAVKYFKEKVKGGNEWLDSKRPVSPSWHLQFSEALSNFALYCDGRIVKHHHGQLIYAGGDDVLAMVPADEAIECALGLQMAFQGKAKLKDKYPKMFAEAPEGFIRLNKEGDWKKGARCPSEPSWPLLVPGPAATVSVGIAIGHIKEPLQDMVQAARDAEKRAKAKSEKEVWDKKKFVLKPNEGWNRDALAVTLFKRSGETIKWGVKFGSKASKAFDLLDEMKNSYRVQVGEKDRQMPISGRFPYRIAELLNRYDINDFLTDELKEIAEKEMEFVVKQQTDEEIKRNDGSQFSKTKLEELCKNYLNGLANSGENNEVNKKTEKPEARPLKEFINLFLLEAFMSRKGE